MRFRSRWSTVGTAVVTLLATVPSARAQTPQQGQPASVRSALPPDAVIWVTATDGREWQGRVVSASGPELRLAGRSGQVSVDWDEIGLVEANVQDPIANGVWNGALTGGLSAAGFAGFIVALVCSIEGCDASDVTEFALLWSGVGAGVGAATGALVDRARPSRQVVHPELTRTQLGDLRLGERVWVSTRDGRLLQGRLLDSSAANLALAAAGARIPVAIEAVESVAVERADGLGNGIRNGVLGGAGAMAGLLLVGQASSGSCCEPLTTVYWTAVGGGIGALAGAGIDAFLPSREVAFRPGGRGAASMRVAPTLERAGVGLRVSVRW